MPSVRFSSEETSSGNNSGDGSTAPPGSILRNPGPDPPTDTTAQTSKTKLHFFRNFFNQRNNDYRSDRPVAVTASRRAAANPGDYRNVRSSSAAPPLASGNASSVASSSEEDSPAALSRLQRWFSVIGSYLRPSRASLDRMTILITSRIWQVLLVFFTILLLFGAQFQELWVPKEGDLVFDILFTVALAVFALDIVFRIYTEPQYFEFFLCGRTPGDSPVAWGSCRLGSFMFWCDLLSSATLLYDISYINTSFFDTETIGIKLDKFGLPVRVEHDAEVRSHHVDPTHALYSLSLDLRAGRNQSCTSSGVGAGTAGDNRAHCSRCSVYSGFHCGEDIVQSKLVLVL